MPKANKKRGQRGGQKRKLEDGDDGPERVEGSKRRKSSMPEQEQDFIALEDGDGPSMAPSVQATERPFFGMLDDDEQEYFKRADDMLESNAFATLEERTLFLANLYREADGKELKIASSQSCSRLMERLIQLSMPNQLKKLFQKFSGK